MDDKEIAKREYSYGKLDKVKQDSESDFDKNLIYITAGTLVLSLTFVEKIAPLTEAIYIWQIITSWGLLAASLILNVISHWVTIKSAIKLGQRLWDVDISTEEYNRQIDRENVKIMRWNTATLGTMILGIFFLVLYCSLNTLNMSKDGKKASEVFQKRQVKDIIEKGRTLSRIPTLSQQSAQSQSNTPNSTSSSSDKK